jgi:hypothetical protein
VSEADQVLSVTRADAERVYGGLSQFRVTVRLSDDGWHVDYELADPRANGGGPRCVVDTASEKIVSKRYDQ